MGVSGAGKSTVAAILAGVLGVDLADADDLHPPENVEAMSAGRALADADRGPWLHAVASWLAAHPEGGVVACSALRRRYRDILRAGAPRTVVLHLDGDPAVVESRLAARQGHFMPVSLLGSQLATLEPLEEGVVMDLASPAEEIARRFAADLTAPPTTG